MSKEQYKFESLRDEYNRLWSSMEVLEDEKANAQARRIVASKHRYEEVERTTGVPWFVVGALHMRESNGRFDRWLHNGDPMVRDGMPAQTVQVPKGRPPNPNCTWEEGAYDALAVVETTPCGLGVVSHANLPQRLQRRAARKT